MREQPDGIQAVRILAMITQRLSFAPVGFGKPTLVSMIVANDLIQDSAWHIR